jgi:hypothetical protein
MFEASDVSDSLCHHLRAGLGIRLLESWVNLGEVPGVAMATVLGGGRQVVDMLPQFEVTIQEYSPDSLQSQSIYSFCGSHNFHFHHPL